MTEIKLTKRYPQSRTEDIVDAYMRGWNDALDAVQNGKFIINDDRKTENSSEKPNNSTISKMEQVEYEPQTSCKTCRYGEVDEGYVRCAYYSKSGEQDEPQTNKGVSYSDHTDYDEPKTYVTWTEPADCPWK